jgi:hypothetical protein
MSVEYTIAAIPTLYRGRMYRSRLEARWAAFFDRLGWTHEYEPFDLGKWSPDFAIKEPFDALIEIKPITEPYHELFERVCSASKGPTFVFGVSPWVNEGTNCWVTLGWWAASYQPAGIIWVRHDDRPGMYADLFSTTNPPDTWVTATKSSGPASEWPEGWSYEDYTMALWSDACNAVQWEPKR